MMGVCQGLLQNEMVKEADSAWKMELKMHVCVTCLG